MHTNSFCITLLLQNLKFLFECQRTSSPSKSNLVSTEYQGETSLKVKYVCWLGIYTSILWETRDSQKADICTFARWVYSAEQLVPICMYISSLSSREVRVLRTIAILSARGWETSALVVLNISRIWRTWVALDKGNNGNLSEWQLSDLWWLFVTDVFGNASVTSHSPLSCLSRVRKPWASLIHRNSVLAPQ